MVAHNLYTSCLLSNVNKTKHKQMKHGRTSRRRGRKSTRKHIDAEMLPERMMKQWMCTKGFNKRDCHVAVRCFTGAVSHVSVFVKYFCRLYSL